MSNLNLALFWQSGEYDQSIRLFTGWKGEVIVNRGKCLTILHGFKTKRLCTFWRWDEGDFQIVFQLHNNGLIRWIPERISAEDLDLVFCILVEDARIIDLKPRWIIR